MLTRTTRPRTRIRASATREGGGNPVVTLMRVLAGSFVKRRQRRGHSQRTGLNGRTWPEHVNAGCPGPAAFARTSVRVDRHPRRRVGGGNHIHVTAAESLADLSDGAHSRCGRSLPSPGSCPRRHPEILSGNAPRLTRSFRGHSQHFWKSAPPGAELFRGLDDASSARVKFFSRRWRSGVQPERGTIAAVQGEQWPTTPT